MKNPFKSLFSAKGTQTEQLMVLDSISANVMIADANRNIVYMNKAVKSFLSEAESTIQKDLPNFRVRDLIGQNIDIFHKKPEHQKKMLETLTKKHDASIKVGGRMFDLVAGPIVDNKGKRLATYVEWKDAELRLQNIDYKSLADALSKSQAIIHFDLQGNILTANENFLKTVGYSMDQIVGKHHSMFVSPGYKNSPDYAQF